jgi:hypothetical protein
VRSPFYLEKIIFIFAQRWQSRCVVTVKHNLSHFKQLTNPEKAMKALTKIRQRIANFDKDERGMETLQVVLIVAVAAIILALIVHQWPKIREWAEEAIKVITGFKNEK